MNKQINIKTAKELVAILQDLIDKFGDLPVYIDLMLSSFTIDSVNYTTTEDGDKYISLNNFS